MRLLLLVFLAGGAGSALRFVGATALTRLTGGVFPWGTLAVNLVGCLLFGLVSHLGLETRLISRQAALAISAGFLGGLTTFSSFAYEGFRMAEKREFLMFAAYNIGSLALGMAAVWLGLKIGRALF